LRLAATPRFPDPAAVSYLYSLYDALVSINVPSDKARAVVDAMEHDMGTTLATKKDLEAQTLVTKKDLELLRLATKQDIEVLRLEQKRDTELLRKEMDNRFALVDEKFHGLRTDLVTMRQSIIIQLGSVIVVCLGLALAIVRFWI
jgi:hypothetical protein